MENYDNFDQLIMGLEVSQTEDPLKSQVPQLVHYGASMEEACTHTQCSIFYSLLPYYYPVIKGCLEP